MHRLFIFLLLSLSLPAFAVPEIIDDTINGAAETVEEIGSAIDEINEQYEQCEELYKTIRESECANNILGIFGRMFLKLGVSFTERQLKFQETATEENAFILSSGLKPRPIFSVALQDSYFSESNWGYGFGFNYFDDYAFEQSIERGSSADSKTKVDLGTYSSMGVIAINPSLFYTWGRGDSTPNRYFKAGIGLNLMYSKVRGTAYITEDETDATCYAQGSALVDGSSTDIELLKTLCASTSYRESSYGTGAKLFIAGEWNKWESELSISLYNHRSQGDYRFITQETQVAFSRKFEF